AALGPDDVGCQVGDALPGAIVQLHQRTGIEGEDVDQAVARCRVGQCGDAAPSGPAPDYAHRFEPVERGDRRLVGGPEGGVRLLAVDADVPHDARPDGDGATHEISLRERTLDVPGCRAGATATDLAPAARGAAGTGALAEHH